MLRRVEVIGVLMMTHVDNINADQVPYLIEQLMAKGAGNVHVIPAITKKGRPEFILLVDTDEERAASISVFLAAELGTLGIRCFKADHISFDYCLETMKVSLKDDNGEKVWTGNVRVKLVKDSDGRLLSARAEHEDLKSAARVFEAAGAGITFWELKQLVENEALRRFEKTGFKVEVEYVSGPQRSKESNEN